VSSIAAEYQIIPANFDKPEIKESQRKKARNSDKNMIFSIGFKLVSIVTLIVLLSLGSITVLVSWLVRQDLQISAEDANFETNRRSAQEAEDTLSKMRSDALIFIHTIANAGDHDNFSQLSTNYFFRQNPRIAAIGYSLPHENQLFINEQYFLTNDINTNLVSSFADSNTSIVKRTETGETIVLNAAPHFTIHLLAIFFPGEIRNSSMMVLFSPENLNTSFGTGVNRSWMINSSDDILIHSDIANIRNAVNVSDQNFIRDIKASPQKSRQALIETDFGITQVQSSNTWENIKQNVLSVYNICADFIFNLFKIERKKSGEEKTNAVRQFSAYTKLNTGGCIVITSIEYDKVFEGITATTRRNIYLTIAVLALSIMFIWFFAKSISIPLKILAAAAHSIEGGEFNINIGSNNNGKRRDEIGVLTNSFHKMTSALHIFGRFTNKEIAIKAMRNQIKPGGLPKHATVFFSDIRGFTAKSETFTNIFGSDASNRIIHWLNEYFTQMIDCVEKTGGTIDKFIGDAVMAHWGTAYSAGSPAKDAIACVKAALMMRKALYEMNMNRRKGDLSDPPIQIGCGINTGIVTAGQLGSDQRMEYTVIGDPVNLASRIEALTKPLGADILISEYTYNFVNKFFITEEMPSVTVKGKEKPLRIFAVVGLAGTNKGPQTLAAVRKLLGIKAPDLENTDIDADEKKYKIGEEKKE